jgi:hypothetical protein
MPFGPTLPENAPFLGCVYELRMEKRMFTGCSEAPRLCGTMPVEVE